MKLFLKLACWMWFAMMCVISVAAQNTSSADLRGVVTDPSGGVILGATVTVRDEGNNFARVATTNSEGYYQFSLLPPGNYTMTVTAPGFAKITAKDVNLTVGQVATVPIGVKLAAASQEVTVNAEAAVVETTRTAVSGTVDQQRINNLPINTRDYTSLALTLSTVGRDHGRTIGPAPTSNLNIGGQRGRSTLVQVDGADNTDTSINAARSTLSQEAVQEFQVITNSYAAEYGRASGGIINVVSKRGGNDFHGDAFGFLRHKSFQAHNAFSPVPDPPFTRTQYGATFGGPIVKDKTFFFGAFEQRRRQEAGFFTTNVTQDLTSSVIIGGQTFGNLTAAEAQFINGLLALPGGAGVPAAVPYAFLASSGGATALNGTNPLVVFPGLAALTPIPAGSQVGGRFLLSGAGVPVSTVNAAGLPIAFRPLTQLQRIFPVSEGTTFSSLRVDHRFNDRHVLSLSGSFNPSLANGLQVESQNQSLGQNDVSRTGVQQLRDWSAVAGLNSTLSPRLVNEANFNWGRRSAQFRSQNGDAVAYNIGGTAFIGRELFSPVRRVESRYQLRDNISLIAGHHNMKFGADFNHVGIDATFELNFAGLFNFGTFSAATLLCSNPANPCPYLAAPQFTPTQSYGLGVPSSYIQGFGNPASTLTNKPLAFFWQDSWQVTKKLNLNYGIRYDVELTQQIGTVPFTDPLTGTVLSADTLLAAQNTLNVQQGIPRDNNNFAPRFGFAWQPWGDGKSVFRGAYGLFYDHPLGAVAFNSDIADASQQQQFVALFNSPSPTTLLNATQIFQGTVCPSVANPSRATNPFCAALPASVVTPGVANTAIYQAGRQRFNDQTFPGFGPVLPFTLPVTKNFQYAYAHQGSLGFEHQFTNELTFSIGGLWVGTRHLPRPIDINAPDNDLILQNFRNFSGGANPANSTQALAFSVPLASNAKYTVVIPGLIAVNNATGARFVNPFAANFFRPSGPNYFLVTAATGGAVSKAIFDGALAGSPRTAGLLSPFGEVDAQSSTGTSNYRALTADVKKRFSHNFQFLGSYTWSHTIDDSSDLQTLLKPQDNRTLAGERADSLFDQRHRFVFSGVLTSPAGWRNSAGFLGRILADFTVAPVIEVSSGRPFNILTNTDTNNDQTAQTDRPNVGANGVLTLPGNGNFDPTCGCFPGGNLGRNKGITTPFASVDLRIGREFSLTERLRLNVLADGFNLLNRNNEAAASPFFTDVNTFNKRAGSKYQSRPTASFDPRQFQFGLKLSF